MKKEDFIKVAEIITDINDFEVVSIVTKDTYFELKYKWGQDFNTFFISRRNKSIYFGHCNAKGNSINQFGHQKAIEYLQNKYGDLSEIFKTGLS